MYDPAIFDEKLAETLDYHNFFLARYFNTKTIDAAEVRDAVMALAPQIEPMMADVSSSLHIAQKAGHNLLFEGAQGALLDVDHGTYPYVTSSNCVAGAAAAGAGVGPQSLHYVLGIAKAYTTRVGAGPFPTELLDDTGARLATEIGRAHV